MRRGLITNTRSICFAIICTSIIQCCSADGHDSNDEDNSYDYNEDDKDDDRHDDVGDDDHIGGIVSPRSC
jgi:hypothetical protein